MSWPLASHFSAVLQSPTVAFRDPRLRQCSILKDAQNQPRPWAGSFAVVYKATYADTGEPLAVRVFTTESPERRERYEQISAYLQSRKLKCLCDFEYRDDGIRSAGDGKWYPLILMDWVEGDTLFHWARSRCIEGNGPALAAAAKNWLELVKELADSAVSHGDLQHANVMVTRAGQLKLVDYDCMCVPSLVGRRNLEVGVDPYQHPDRNETTLLSLDLDRFSALMIHLALRALAADPGLWQRHVEQPGYDKLLFRREDFQQPDHSPLRRELLASPAADVRELTGHLFQLHQARMDQIPPLSQLANSYAEVEALLRAQKWTAAVEVLNRRGHFRDAPEHLKPAIHQAYQYVCRRQAWNAFTQLKQETSERGDRQLAKAWNEPLFAGFEPAERARLRVRDARRRVTALDRLALLVQQASGTMTLPAEQGLVETAEQFPKGYQYSLAKRVEQARRRVTAVGRLEKALADATSEALIIAAWRAAKEAECEELLNAAWQPRIELAQRRAPALKKLHDIPDDLPADRRDRQILDTYQEELLAECREAKPWREAYQLAARRKELLEQLKQAVKRSDTQSIERLAAESCLVDYPMPAKWAKPLQAAREKVDPADALFDVLQGERLAAFHEVFDARAVRNRPQRFAPFESLMAEWTRREILPPQRLGLRSKGRKGLVAQGKSADVFRACWVWPPKRVTQQCVLAICRREPDGSANPQQVDTWQQITVDRDAWEADGEERLLHVEPDWIGAHVVVWATVELGFRTFYSQPLVLGRIEKGSRWPWKGLPLFASRGKDTDEEDRAE